MKKILLFAFSCVAAFYSAQYTTAGDGTTYTLASLSAAAPTALSYNGSFYTMNEDIIIAAGDILSMDENTTLKVAPGLTLYVQGSYKTNATDFTITAVDTANPFKGIRFEDGSSAEMKNTLIEYGGGIRVLTGDFLMDNCIVSKNNGGISTSGAIGFSKGNPVVKNSQFLENQKAAFGSAANATVSATFDNNYLYKNVQGNTNTPQINMGPGGEESIKIINNTIIGDRTKTKAGGISASALLGGTNKILIEGNIIRDNRYGITSYGSTSTGIIRNNIIENNDTENAPASGGSGISLSSAQNIRIEGNEIRNNLWGITLLNNATIDMGTVAAPGNNIFKDNGNGGVTYALYNNTSNPQTAVGNCWREGELSTDAMVEAVIVDQTDDSSLGLVTYKPYNCAYLATAEAQVQKLSVYPNPSAGEFTVRTQETGNYIITDLSGKLVASGFLQKGENKISLQAAKGIYLLNSRISGKRSTLKIMIH